MISSVATNTTTRLKKLLASIFITGVEWAYRVTTARFHNATCCPKNSPARHCAYLVSVYSCHFVFNCSELVFVNAKPLNV